MTRNDKRKRPIGNEQPCKHCTFVWPASTHLGRFESYQSRCKLGKRKCTLVTWAALEGGLGRGSYVVGSQWDEGNMVHAMKRFGGSTVGWRFGDG